MGTLKDRLNELAEEQNVEPAIQSTEEMSKGSKDQASKGVSEQTITQKSEHSISYEKNGGSEEAIDSTSAEANELPSVALQVQPVVDRMTQIPFKHNFPGNEAERKMLDDLRDLIASKTGKKAPRKEDLYRQFFYEGIDRMKKKYERMD